MVEVTEGAPIGTCGTRRRGLYLEVDKLTVKGDGNVGFAQAIVGLNAGVADRGAAHGFEDGHDLALGIDVPFAVVAGGVAAVEGGGDDVGPPGARRRAVVGGIVGEEGSTDEAGAGGNGFEAGGATEGVTSVRLGVNVA